MQEMFDRLQQALAHEFRTQFTAMGAQLEERLEQRLVGGIDTRLEESERRVTGRIDARLEAAETRLIDRIDARLEAAETRLLDHIDTRLEAAETRLVDRIDTRLEATETRLEERLSAQLEEQLGSRLDARVAEADVRLSRRLRVQTEDLREIVRTAADNYGGVLDGMRRELADFRQEWRDKCADTDRVLLDHGQRIVTLEQITGGARE